MKFEISTNKLINDIMAREGGSVMLFAPKGSGKSEFLTALASRYRTTYWFSPATDDFELFALCLAKKILSAPEDSEAYYKVSQLIYAQSEFNDDTVILSYLLDYIQNKKENTLLVLEQMESAPPTFNYRLVEWLISQCPKNLVVVVSSEWFVNFNFTRFEKKWPKLIDENLLNGKYLELIEMDEYLDGLTPTQISFLHYITQLKSLDAAFVEGFYPDGAKVLAMLAAKGGYVLPRDTGFYRINGVLKDFLNNAKPECIGDWWDIDVFRRLGEYRLSKGEGYQALKLFIAHKNLDGALQALDFLFKTERSSVKLLGYVKSYPNDNVLMNCEHNYARVYQVIRLYVGGEYAAAIRLSSELLTVFTDWKQEVARVLRTVYFMCLVKSGDKEGSFVFRQQLLEEYADDLTRMDTMLCELPFLYRNFWGLPLDVKQIQLYEDIVNKPGANQNIWYVRAREAVTEAYLASAHLKEALDNADKLKDYLPFYVIPHKLFVHYFYVYDVEDARKIVDRALQYSEMKGLTTDRCFLYSAQATIEHYYGKMDEAIKLLDKADKDEEIRDYAKFMLITKRCVYLARSNQEGYAREVANTYLKFAEVYNKEFVSMMNFAVAFCAFKQGDFENAYYYAIRSVKGSNAKDVYWLGAMAIATTCLLGKNGIDEPKTLIANIFRSAKNFRMDMMLVELSDIIGVIMDFAKSNDIETEFIRRVDKKIALRNGLQDETKSVTIKMFGTTSIMVNNVEIQWKTKKSKDLFLHYLLAGEQGLDRSVIIDLLWNGYMYDSAINNLKTTNNIIRKTLKDAGLDFKLDYLNGKYLLRMKNYALDYERFGNLLKSFAAEDNPTKKMMLLDEVFTTYGQDFAVDMTAYADMRNLAKEIAQQKVISTITVIRALAKVGNFVDAKRLLSKLDLIDPKSDYKEMRKEIDRKINVGENDF